MRVSQVLYIAKILMEGEDCTIDVHLHKRETRALLAFHHLPHLG